MSGNLEIGLESDTQVGLLAIDREREKRKMVVKRDIDISLAVLPSLNTTQRYF